MQRTTKLIRGVVTDMQAVVSVVLRLPNQPNLTFEEGGEVHIEACP